MSLVGKIISGTYKDYVKVLPFYNTPVKHIFDSFKKYYGQDNFVFGDLFKLNRNINSQLNSIYLYEEDKYHITLLSDIDSFYLNGVIFEFMIYFSEYDYHRIDQKEIFSKLKNSVHESFSLYDLMFDLLKEKSKKYSDIQVQPDKFKLYFNAKMSKEYVAFLRTAITTQRIGSKVGYIVENLFREYKSDYSYLIKFNQIKEIVITVVDIIDNLVIYRIDNFPFDIANIKSSRKNDIETTKELENKIIEELDNIYNIYSNS